MFHIYVVKISILDFIRECLLAHISFPFWLLALIGQFIVCAKKRAKAVVVGLVRMVELVRAFGMVWRFSWLR